MDEQTAHTPPKETQPSLDLRTSTILLTLQRVLLEALDFEEVVRRIVNQLLMEPYFHERGYRIIVLNLVDEERAVLKRISLSSTPEAENAQKASAVPFHQIEIPLSAQDNLLIRCLTTQQPQLTHTWPELFVPVLTPEQALRNQTAAGIKTSLVYPVVVQGNAIGALIFGLIVRPSEGQAACGRVLAVSRCLSRSGPRTLSWVFVAAMRPSSAWPGT